MSSPALSRIYSCLHQHHRFVRILDGEHIRAALGRAGRGVAGQNNAGLKVLRAITLVLFVPGIPGRGRAGLLGALSLVCELTDLVKCAILETSNVQAVLIERG